MLKYSSRNVGTSFANLNSVIGHLTNAMKVNECCYNYEDVEDLMTLELERYKQGQPDETFIERFCKRLFIRLTMSLSRTERHGRRGTAKGE